ncbi:MAG: TetR/AcrR family transcriptional regulator [Anaerolineales bacterium]
MTKVGRQPQGTRERLQHALIELIRVRGYEGITIQDVVDRAGVGRTTFYLHFPSKDDLFLSCHEAIVSQFDNGLPHARSREELLAPKASAGMIAAYQHLAEARAHLNPILQGKEGYLILRGMRERNAHAIEAALQDAFTEAASTLPLGVLANYLAGAQIALVQWWLEKRQPYSAEDLAQTFQRLQRSAISEAFGLQDDHLSR